MSILFKLFKRNTKMFFKDKAMFLSSMITPMILILLFVTFLGNVYKDSFKAIAFSYLVEGAPAGQNIEITNKMIDGFVGGWLFSSLFATCTITIAFCSNLLMVQDKAEGNLPDILISPVKKSTLALSYFLSSAFVTLVVCYSAMLVGFVYLAMVGWYLSILDILLIMSDILILVLFGTALSSIIHYFLKTQGQMSVVGTLVSSVYGFICGAYMPISQFSPGLQKVLSFFPGIYGSSLLRRHYLNGALTNMSNNKASQEMIDALKQGFDIDISFFGNVVPTGVSYVIIIGSVGLLLGIYVLINIFGKKAEKRS